MRYQLETITPEMARNYLKNNLENNRPISQKWVDTIVELMDNGSWLNNGETIKFQKANGDGRELLLDGQHRLKAIIKRKKPTKVLVVRDLEPEVFQSIDGGKKRTAADVLSIAGYKQATTLAAAARVLINFKYNWDFAERYKQVPSGAILDCVKEFPKLQDSCNIGHRGRFIVSGSQLVFLHYVTAIEHPEIAMDFVIKLAQGTNLALGDPILAFRERMFKYKAASARLARQQTIRMLITAWNHHFTGTRIKQLRINENDPYPMIKGVDRVALFGPDYAYPPERLDEEPPKNKGLSNNVKQGNLFKDLNDDSDESTDTEDDRQLEIA